MDHPHSTTVSQQQYLARILLGVLVVFLGLMTVQCSQGQGDSSNIASARPPTEPDSTNPVQPVSMAFPGNETFIRVAKDAMASVVNISSTRKPDKSNNKNPFPFFDDPFFRKFFGEEFEHRFRPPQNRRDQGLGSGVIVQSDGYIVTNNHVVEQADQLMVLLGDNRKMKATLVGTDPKTDLAVIKIDASGLPTLPWGNSSELQVGEMVLAVGNPFGLNQTVTMGIISAVGRANMGIVDYEDFIQTDAAINPGNSGGALVNLHGQLIGINTAIFSRTGGYMGIGFSIPSNMVKGVMNSLIRQGKVTRGWLGVSIQELNTELAQQFSIPDTAGALIGDVVANSPAEAARLQRGDVIRTYDGKAVKDPNHLRSLVAETFPQANVSLEIIRDGSVKQLNLTIGEMPQDLEAFNARPTNGETEHHALTGIRVEPAGSTQEPGLEGAKISSVASGSPGEKAGLRPGDIILELNRTSVKSVDDYRQLIRNLDPETPVLILLKRGSGTIYVSIKP
ncbi:MAG: DegQ family serine endoprotease [Nitrospirae bacterium]|nr:DegQ family serine endoprotease [Nitrospirota bacterium]